MTPHEIRPSQLRALLLLLVLVPLIPTGLMVRFMSDTVHSEHAAAIERMSAIYQQTLENAGATFARHIAGRHESVTPRETHNYYRALLDRDVLVRVIDANGNALTGSTVVTTPPIAQAYLRDAELPWAVQVFLLDADMLNHDQQQQFRSYLWIVGVTLVVILLFAVLGVRTVSVQIELRELRSTAVATVAHELRTPLASMRMLVDTLREGRYRGDEQLGEYLALIALENERLTRLCDAFLTFSRLERRPSSTIAQPVSPHAIIEQAVTAMKARLDAPGCTFTLDEAENLPDIAANRDDIVTVLTNLLDNALKYSDADKRIALRARAVPDGVAFSVEDNGIGIPHAEQGAIFRPFHQLDAKLARSREGIGLGLSIVRRLVEAHNGRVEVASEPGRGSIFTVTIPAASRSV